MEEDIKYLQRFIDKCKLRGCEFYGILHPPHFEMLQNLINKYKELEETNNILSGAIKSLMGVGEEHLEMINLMAIQLAKTQSSMKKVCKECPFEECLESKPKNCVIEYFRKKAKGE